MLRAVGFYSISDFWDGGTRGVTRDLIYMKADVGIYIPKEHPLGR